jgi:type VI secretion system protein ImpC
MPYDASFGRLTRTPRAAGVRGKFRLAVLGDFSGRANAGTLETGPALAGRKPIRLDVDSFDTVLERMGLSLTLPLNEDDAAVSIPIDSLDDFHPDQLIESVALFQQLRDLRRRLGSRTGFDKAARQVLGWAGGTPLPRPPRHARGTAIAADRRLSDFARLVGRPTAPRSDDGGVDALLRRVVGPFIQRGADPRQDSLIARVDEALSAAMRSVLHHPDFQAAEATWRGLDFLVRRIDTGPRMEIVLYDVSAEEFAADLAATDALEDTGLYGMLVEQPAMDARQGPLSAVIGLYGFELTPPHADLLGRIARIAAAVQGPFVAGIGPDALKTPLHDQHPLIQEAWTALQVLPEAAWLGLVAPRFLLRPPYGKRSDPIDAFAFEEFTPQEGLGAMLWGHPALLAGLLLAETWQQQGARMRPGTVLGVGDMPYFVYPAPDGEQVALPCTDRLYTEREAARLAAYRVMPVLSLRGRPEVRLGGFTAVAGTPLAGFWAPAVQAGEAVDAADPAPSGSGSARPSTPVGSCAEARVTPGYDGEAGDEDVIPEPAIPEPAIPECVVPECVVPSGAAGAPDDLDALLANLNKPPPAADTEADLDDLLAALK